MGLLKAYAIYKYGRVKGELAYREACRDAEIALLEGAARREAAKKLEAVCSRCNHRYGQHSDNGACPTYDE